jgi:hypothetical protein
VQTIKDLQAGAASALNALQNRQELDQSREELKNRIAEARIKAGTALSTLP